MRLLFLAAVLALVVAPVPASAQYVQQFAPQGYSGCSGGFGGGGYTLPANYGGFQQGYYPEPQFTPQVYYVPQFSPGYPTAPRVGEFVFSPGFAQSSLNFERRGILPCRNVRFQFSTQSGFPQGYPIGGFQQSFGGFPRGSG
jgi:hypothetical protein